MSEKTPLVLAFLGKSGAGKGTQARLITEKLELEYIGSGELLRKRKETDDFTGNKISQAIDGGGLVPTPVVFKLWMDKFEEFKKKEGLRGIAMDGSPRKFKEAYLLEDAVAWYDWTEGFRVVLIDISDEEAIKRLSSRRICKQCGNGVSLGEGEEITACPKCGGEMFQREDDTREGIEKRLEWYRTDVDPVIGYFTKKNRIIRINGEQPVEKVFEDVLKAIGYNEDIA